jgi:predicted ATPase
MEQFKGEFLPFFSLPDADQFDYWLTLMRESINKLAIQGFSWKLQYHENRSEWNSAYLMAQNILKLAPWDEQVHARAIHCLLELGQTSTAIAHYQNTINYLKRELDIEPGRALENAKQQIEDSQTSLHFAEPRPKIFTQFPHFSTTFIGRTHEIEVIEGWIADPFCNIITITGPGGSGKTRLATQIAEFQTSLFTDGVFFISLVGCQTKEQISASVLRSLRAIPEQGKDAFDELTAWAANRQALLILDNVENTEETAGFAAQISELAPHLVLLFTAYSRLNLLGEKVFTLAGLPLFKQKGTHDPSEAVQLYLSHLQPESLPEYHSADFLENADRICALVEGFPLAIALAAGQTRCMPTKELLAEIQHNMDVLQSLSVNYPERQRSIQASFENSWNHLSEEKQRSLALLTSFNAPFTSVAAEAVFSITAPDLRDLASESLLTWDAEERYRFHRTIFQYAREKAHFSESELKKIKGDYRSWFLHRLEQLNALQDLEQTSEKLQTIEIELADMIRATHLFIIAAEWEQAKIMMQGLYRYFEDRGLFRDGSEQFSELIDLCASHPDGLECQVLAYSKRALLSLRAGENDLAAALIDTAFTATQKLSLRSELAFCYNVRAAHALALGSAADAEGFACQALEVAQQIEDEEEICHAYYNIGHARINKGDVSLGFEALTKCKLSCEQLRNWRRLSKALNSLADIACYRSDLDLALDYFTQALTIAQKIGNQYSEALITNNIGTVYMELCDYEQAKIYLNQSIHLCQAIFDREGEAVALSNLGEIALNEGDLHECIRVCKKSLEISLAAGSNWGEMSARVNLAQALIKLRDLPAASQHIRPLLLLSLQTDSLNFFYRGLVEAARYLIATDQTRGLAAVMQKAMQSEGMEDLTRRCAQELISALEEDEGSAEDYSNQQILDFLLQKLPT